MLGSLKSGPEPQETLGSPPIHASSPQVLHPVMNWAVCHGFCFKIPHLPRKLFSIQWWLPDLPPTNGRYGPLRAATSRYGPLRAATGRYGPLRRLLGGVTVGAWLGRPIMPADQQDPPPNGQMVVESTGGRSTASRPNVPPH